MDSMTYRPDMGVFGESRYPDKNGHVAGIFFSNGTEWKEQRQFSMRKLREFGFGKLSMEEVINGKIQNLKSLVSH